MNADMMSSATKTFSDVPRKTDFLSKLFNTENHPNFFSRFM